MVWGKILLASSEEFFKRLFPVLSLSKTNKP